MTGIIAALAIAVCFSSGLVAGLLWQGIRHGGVMDLHLENAALQAQNDDLRDRLDEHRRTRLPQPRAGRPPIRTVNGSDPA